MSWGDDGPGIPALDWIPAGRNEHEDLHFSSYYLRRSHASLAHESLGYSWIAARFEAFGEVYYLPRSECSSVADRVIAHLERDPRWFRSILQETEARSRRLSIWWPVTWSSWWFSGRTTAELMELYQQHHRLQDSLYEICRVPEALDRGVRTFTTRLYERLGDRGIDEAEIGPRFQAVTARASGGILADEERTLEALADKLWKTVDPDATIYRQPEMALLLLPAEIKRHVREYVDQWRHLSYHGYGRRKGVSEWDAAAEVARMAQGMHDGTHTVRARSVGTDELAEDTLGRFSPEERALFDLYVDIGQAKVLRRSWQLKNFRYLDALLGDLALRLDIPEWNLRCLLPQELMALIGGRTQWTSDLASRATGFTYLHSPSAEVVLPLSASDILIPSPDLQGPHSSQGMPIFPGLVEGRAVVVLRYDSAAMSDFGPSDILVAHSTDPDLIPLIRLAGAVVTEDGGVTSHAAVICRELEVPCVVGCEGIVAACHSRPIIQVDATHGTVAVLEEVK